MQAALKPLQGKPTAESPETNSRPKISYRTQQHPLNQVRIRNPRGQALGTGSSWRGPRGREEVAEGRRGSGLDIQEMVWREREEIAEGKDRK